MMGRMRSGIPGGCRLFGSFGFSAGSLRFALALVSPNPFGVSLVNVSSRRGARPRGRLGRHKEH